MHLIAAKILVGLAVGTLIGLTGLGGGVLLLPILIFGLRVPVITAVGSDALFNFFTKIPASIVHLKKGSVRRKVVLALAVGSVPGSACGVAYLTHLRHLYGDGANAVIKLAIGILLVCIPVLLMFQTRIEDRMVNRSPTLKSFAGMTVIGLCSGFLVGMTSVGSGSIIMMMLLLFYSYPPKVNVGTDIVHAVVLTGITGFMHFRLGNVDPGLVGALLIGSIPGGLIGSYLSTRVPVVWLRRILCLVLLITGARMIWA
jgi:uncharacterized membrane protein YfcA